MYKYKKMVIKATALLVRYNSAYENLFNRAIAAKVGIREVKIQVHLLLLLQN